MSLKTVAIVLAEGVDGCTSRGKVSTYGVGTILMNVCRMVLVVDASIEDVGVVGTVDRG